jgi:uncharacterized protein YjbI with pentapeptide repeats
MLQLKNRKLETDKLFDSDETSSNFSDHVFVRLSAKDRRFSGVNFRYSTFDSCYIRKCIFEDCDFIGCKFLSSNLHGSVFIGCKFDYTTFDKTLITSEILDTCCPALENLKSRFARSLRVNYQSLGDAQSANKAISVELGATEIHLYKAWRSNEAYYRAKYNGLHRFNSFFSWATFRLLDFIWGNGESWSKLARTVCLLCIVIAFYDVLTFRDPSLVCNYTAALLAAPQTFLGTNSPQYPGILLAIIVFVRLVVMGLFMSILVRRFARR